VDTLQSSADRAKECVCDTQNTSFPPQTSTTQVLLLMLPLKLLHQKKKKKEKQKKKKKRENLLWTYKPCVWTGCIPLLRFIPPYSLRCLPPLSRWPLSSVCCIFPFPASSASQCPYFRSQHPKHFSQSYSDSILPDTFAFLASPPADSSILIPDL